MSAGAEALPAASVIVPAYDAARFLTQALDSARWQTERRIEILVIDDASRDATADIAERAAAADPRVRVLRLPSNRGPAGARNAGLAAARGTWIALLDADDRFHPERVERLTALGERTGADMVSDNLLLCPEADPAHGEPMIPDALLSATKRMEAVEFIQRNVGSRHYPRVSYGFMHPIIRRDFLVRHGLRYDERNRFGEDFLLYIQCLVRGASWWITPEPLYRYTVRAGSLTEVQTSGDLGRIREIERGLLADSRIAADPALSAALRRHKRVIDRSYFYRAFTDAVKAQRWKRAIRLLFAETGSFGHILAEAGAQAPTIISKALRGGYLRGPASR